ncbi:hypothetical protein clusted with conjugative transposons [Mucinivorans hirudinis]|uniref:MobA protein n=1 Tax=Mucinivorans hirudinis TaxID=1433126 RepID=A0A060RAF4_9BACT|nr:hypothetical protein clusted with conjugative transposons [Mucinivorans hirudinis]
MTQNKGGRIPKNDKATHRVAVRFNSVENARFLTMYELSGVQSKAAFIKARVFGDTFRVIKVDRSQLDYYQKLSAFYAQFRATGVNYNQVVVALRSNFTEKKAMAMLHKLEQHTQELVSLNRRIIDLTEDYKTRFYEGYKPVDVVVE